MKDIRETLRVSESFNNIILSLYAKDEEANILYDENGITRATGFIKQIIKQNDKPYILLDNGTQVDINSLIAVNGIFAADYTDC